MSLRPTFTRRRLSRPLAAAAALLLLTGCGTGMKAQTYLQQSESDTTNDAVGRIAVRNLAVQAPAQGFVHPAGSTVPIQMTLVNEGGEDDRLVQATTPAAASVEMLPQAPIEVPRLATADPRSQLVLRGLTRDLPTGGYIDLTLTFERNGTKKFGVPVYTVSRRAAEQHGKYHPAETDSEGNPLPEEEARPETDVDGGEQGEGDAALDDESDPRGDNVQDETTGADTEHR